jgi:ATP-dependent exoDNAse (exonuclease V) beta subunit
MNLIYVAFTRAKAVLYVNGKKAPERKNGMAGRSVNELLQFALEAMATMSDFSGCWNDDKSRFRFGELPAFHSEENPDRQGWIHTYRFFDLRKRIALRSNSDDFLIGEGSAPSSKNRGKLIHEILSGVVKADDLHAACLKAYREGIITSAEQLEISSRLKEKLADPAINHWFDGSFTVLNERNLISPDGVFRPDRMMVSGKYVVIVDYKSGLVKLESYRKQVQKYARLLQACGFERVEGFLWYINLDEIEQVV